MVKAERRFSRTLAIVIQINAIFWHKIVQILSKHDGVSNFSCKVSFHNSVSVKQYRDPGSRGCLSGYAPPSDQIGWRRIPG